jgi:hypothetical protein
MPGPAPSDPSTRKRGNKASTKSVLSVVVDHEIPPMPDPNDWLAKPVIDGEEISLDPNPPQWSPAVIKWWDTIWQSPMSNEYHESDTQQLHLACFYLHQTTNPYIKMAERLAAAAKYESCVRNFGLSPMSRRSLQWEIERVNEAQGKNRRRRQRDEEAAQPARPAGSVDPREADVDDDETNPYATGTDNVTPIR